MVWSHIKDKEKKDDQKIFIVDTSRTKKKKKTKRKQ